MTNVTFKGEPYLFTGDSLDESGALTTAENFKDGRCSYAHYYAPDGIVKRYGGRIGTRADIEIVGPAERIPMDLGDVAQALDNMLGGDPAWRIG